MILHIDAQSRRDSGFTLLEIMVVLAIAGILLGVALERGPLRSEALSFSVARRQVVDLLHQAQDLSETRGETVTVLLDSAEGTFLTVEGHTIRTTRIHKPARVFVPTLSGGMMARASYRFMADGRVTGAPLMVVLGHHAALVSFSDVTGRIQIDER
ncbi:MAG: type II secretion system protein [Gluconobacter albidus]